MTTSYPPPPSRDPPPSLPRRRNDLRSSSPVSSSTSTRTGTPAMDSIRSKLPLRGTGQANQDGENDHEEDGFDVIGYWAIASVCWYAIDVRVYAFGEVVQLYFICDFRTGFSLWPSHFYYSLVYWLSSHSHLHPFSIWLPRPLLGQANTAEDRTTMI